MKKDKEKTLSERIATIIADMEFAHFNVKSSPEIAEDILQCAIDALKEEKKNAENKEKRKDIE